MISATEIEMLGVCAFCEHATHDFPDTAWHEKKHNEGYHTCGIDGGFRVQKPLCNSMQLMLGSEMSSD